MTNVFAELSVVSFTVLRVMFMVFLFEFFAGAAPCFPPPRSTEGRTARLAGRHFQNPLALIGR